MSNIEHHTLVMPSSPEDRKRLKGALDEVCHSKTRIAAEQDQIKTIIATMAEEFDLPKKLLSKAATVIYNESLHKVQAETEDLETLVETLKMSSNVVDNNPAADADSSLYD